jgi:DNA repair exonuclease SbcCD nuclease subunit
MTKNNKSPTTKPIAVLISDIHYNLNTIPLASAALSMAIGKAAELDVDLIIAGDLHDTKANLRAECIDAINTTLQKAKKSPLILVGNHDLINEKSNGNSLGFIKYGRIIQKAISLSKFTIIPYASYIPDILNKLDLLSRDDLIIMHQGITGSHSGEYIQDKSAITKNDLAGRRVISGHYHRRQTIDLPDGGKFDYIGNPFTLNFGEASDPEKGYQILYDDGSLEFVPTNLRKHVIIDTESPVIPEFTTQDLVWVKMSGPKEDLANIKKEAVALRYGITQSFKLDLIPTNSKTAAPKQQESLTQPQVLDTLIDSMANTTEAQKLRLKTLWKDFT